MLYRRLRSCEYLLRFSERRDDELMAAIRRLAPKNIKLLRPQLHGYIVTREEFEKYTTELFSFIDRGELTIDVHKVYDLKDVASAHEVRLQLRILTRHTTNHDPV